VFLQKSDPAKLGGNADDYQNKGVEKKAIRNYMKTKDLQIDPLGGATHKCVKTKGGRTWAVDGGWCVEASYAKTHGVARKRKDRTGTLSAEP
jgi:hypothetical protein